MPFVLEAIHLRVDAIVAADAAELRAIPPTLRRVLLVRTGEIPDDLTNVDVVIVNSADHPQRAELAHRYPDRPVRPVRRGGGRPEPGRRLRQRAHGGVDGDRLRDPTKIPVEIVARRGGGAAGRVITVATDPDDAAVLFGVLERGPEGVLLAPGRPGDVARLRPPPTIGSLFSNWSNSRSSPPPPSAWANVRLRGHLYLPASRRGAAGEGHTPRGMVLCVANTPCCGADPPVPGQRRRDHVVARPRRRHVHPYLSNSNREATCSVVNVKGETRRSHGRSYEDRISSVAPVDAVEPAGVARVNLILPARLIAPGPRPGECRAQLYRAAPREPDSLGFLPGQPSAMSGT